MNNKTTLYIDESGKSSLVETKEPFILTGCIIEDSEISSIEGFFKYIKRKHDLAIEEPFHAYEVFECPKTPLSQTDLQSLSNSLAEFISLIPIKIQIYDVNKNVFRKALGAKNDDSFKGDSKRKELKESPYRLMASGLFAWFANELNNNGTVGQVMCDARRGGDHQLLKTLNLCKEGHVPYKDTNMTSLVSNRISSISFAEKNYLSGGLEITDLISYITYFKVRKLLSKNKNIGVPKIWKSIRESDNYEMLKVEKDDIKRFFRIGNTGVHKDLINR